MSESEGNHEIESINWRRCFSFLEILRSFRMAIHPLKLGLCLLGMLGTIWIGVAIDQVPGIGQTSVHGTSFYKNCSNLITGPLWGTWALPYIGDGTSGEFFQFLMAPVTAARDAVKLAVDYWDQAWPFALVNTILLLALWAVVGGAVTRMAAVRTAREESVPLKQALCFAIRKWPSTVTSPLIPFGVLVALAAVVGLVTAVPTMIPYAGSIFFGLLSWLTLIVGFVMALMFIGGIFSLGLQWPTIAAEGSDSFDAISRSVSYVSSRPWKYLFYTAFSVVYGCLTFIFVKFVAFLTLKITHLAVGTFTTSWWSGGTTDKLVRIWAPPTLADPWPMSGSQADVISNAEMIRAEAFAHFFVSGWVWVVLGLAVAFLISFFFSSQTVIYFLLRRSVDATDMEEVYLEESEEEGLPVEHKVEGPEAPPKSGATPPAEG